MNQHQIEPAALDLLLQLDDGAHGYGLRIPKSPDRDALQRAGLIASERRPFFAKPIAGRGSHWRPTEEGRKFADWWRKFVRGE